MCDWKDREVELGHKKATWGFLFLWSTQWVLHRTFYSDLITDLFWILNMSGRRVGLIHQLKWYWVVART
jgi:hypothetical protein